MGMHERRPDLPSRHPDGEQAGEVDRRGRWQADFGIITTLHARLADTYADLRDPKRHPGRPAQLLPPGPQPSTDWPPDQQASRRRKHPWH